jgi:hypothetical protein
MLSSGRRRLAALKGASWALYDRQLRISGEVDFGGGFPITMLRDVVEQNLSNCDDRLLNLLSNAEQSHFEKQIRYHELTHEDIELHSYIFSEDARLKKILSR